MNCRGTREFTRELIREGREEVRLLTPGAKNPRINELLRQAEASLLKLAKYSARQMKTIPRKRQA